MAVKISSYRNRVKTGLPSNVEELGQGCRVAVLGTVLCKRNAGEITNFGNQIANFRFRRNSGEISVLLLF